MSDWSGILWFRLYCNVIYGDVDDLKLWLKYALYEFSKKMPKTNLQTTIYVAVLRI